jgi:hypothetical protein
MPHIQANLDDETYKEIKKDAIDKDVTMGNYAAEALKSFLKRGSEDAEAKPVDTNQPN